jgi:hypothetical protein
VPIRERSQLVAVNVASGIAVMVGAGLVVFGAFQPWLLERASATCVTAGRTGLELEGRITLGFGITALVLGMLIVAGVRPRLLAIVAVVLFVIVGLLVLWVWYGRHIREGFFGCPAAGAGSAIYVTWMGAALGVVGCVPGIIRPRSRS